VFRVANGKREDLLAKTELDSLSIEELARLRDQATEKLYEKVAARQAELEAELERLAQYARPVKKSQAAPAVAKAKRSDEPKEPVAEAA
jgi:DNA-binding protein H-NS